MYITEVVHNNNIVEVKVMKTQEGLVGWLHYGNITST